MRWQWGTCHQITHGYREGDTEVKWDDGGAISADTRREACRKAEEIARDIYGECLRNNWWTLVRPWPRERKAGPTVAQLCPAGWSYMPRLGLAAIRRRVAEAGLVVVEWSGRYYRARPLQPGDGTEDHRLVLLARRREQRREERDRARRLECARREEVATRAARDAAWLQADEQRCHRSRQRIALELARCAGVAPRDTGWVADRIAKLLEY